MASLWDHAGRHQWRHMRISRPFPIQIGPGNSCEGRQSTASRHVDSAASRPGACPAHLPSSYRARVAASFRRKPGDCYPFAAPDQKAPYAPVVWAEHAVRHKLTAKVHRTAALPDREFDVRHLSLTAHLHLDALGRQHLILKGENSQVVLHISGPLVSVGSVHIRLLVDGLRHLDHDINSLSAFSQLLHGIGRSAILDRPGPVESIKLRDALIALDGERAGATRREIAAVIYGADRVSDEWNEPTGRLKAVIKRDVLRGRRLVAGGYRQLVARGTNSATV